MVYLVIFIYGLLLGSFVNALVWRISLSLDKDGNPKKTKSPSIMNGRSMCPNCKHTLGVADLIPVFSWLLLRGKCRYCKKSISVQYPLVELVTGALFTISYIFWPYEPSTASWTVFCLWLVILTGLAALAVYDLRWMLLPNKILNPLTILAVIYTALTWLLLETDISLIGLASSILIAGGLFYLLFTISDGKWIGGGDVKYGLFAGILLANPLFAFFNIMLASVMGSVIIFFGLAIGKFSLKSKIPFGPFLIVSTIVVYLFGAGFVDWYESSVLLLGYL